MANKGLNMTTQLEIQRLKGLGFSKRKISYLLGIHRNTVNKYFDEVAASEKRFLQPEWFQKLNQVYVKSELENGVPKTVLYDELVKENSLPSYQAFSSYLKKHIEGKKGPKITVRIDRNPGDSMEVDYSGNSISILCPSTGEIQKTELFVGVLSYSSYIYAEFTYSQRLEDFLRSHVNMFKHFGGVSRYIVCDNLKSGVTKSDKFDPELNKSYHDLCSYYGVAIDPARAGRPQDKPVVEAAVGLIQNDFFPRIRKKTYTSIYSLNQDLWDFLKVRSKQVMKDRGFTRDELYLKEMEFLSPLPQYDYEIYYFKKAKVHPDCHLQHEKNFYSVPYKYVGKEVTVKFNKKLVFILWDSEVIATHKAQEGTGKIMTITAHYPEKKLVEMQYIVQALYKQSRLIGENTYCLVKRLFTEPKYPLKNLRKAQSILSFEKRYGKVVLESACEKALLFDKLSYRYIKSCVENYRLNSTQSITKAPQRQESFICLQGGKNE